MQCKHYTHSYDFTAGGTHLQRLLLRRISLCRCDGRRRSQSLLARLKAETAQPLSSQNGFLLFLSLLSRSSFHPTSSDLCLLSLYSLPPLRPPPRHNHRRCSSPHAPRRIQCSGDGPLELWETLWFLRVWAACSLLLQQSVLSLTGVGWLYSPQRPSCCWQRWLLVHSPLLDPCRSTLVYCPGITPAHQGEGLCRKPKQQL